MEHDGTKDRKQAIPIVLPQCVSPTTGQHWWRSLEELADTPEFQRYLHREFPENATQWLAGSRRDFIRLMGASLCLSGVSGCHFKQPQEKIVPAVHSTGHISPGLALYFTTAYDFAGSSIGLTVESRDGRPVKVEGNPNHPSSKGATNVFAQAATLDLYDPDRAQAPMHNGQMATLADVRDQLEALRLRLDQTQGEGLHVLVGASTSPTLGRLLTQCVGRWPKMQWSVYEPLNRDNSRTAWRQSHGSDASNVELVYDFSQADVVLSIDCDFLAARDLPACYIQEFSAARRLEGRPEDLTRSVETMVRLYHLGPTPTPTSAKSDHNLALRPSEIAEVVNELASRVGKVGRGQGEPESIRSSNVLDVRSEWLDRVVEDLETAGSRALVIVGREQPAAIHALADALNRELGGLGNTVRIIESPQVRPPESLSDVAMLEELVSQMNSGQVETLLMLGGNPAFDAPADIDFGEALAKVPYSVSLTHSANETSQKSTFLVPRSHFLESWGDARAHDGTASIIQPLVAPLHESISEIEFLAVLIGDAVSGYAAVRKTWKDSLGDRDDDARWQKALADGVIADSAYSELKSANTTTSPSIAELVRVESDSPTAQGAAISTASERLDIVFRPDSTIWDGRFINNGWLQELPKPLTHVVWDNPALIAPADAQRLRLRNGDMLAVGEDGHQVEVPIWIFPGHAQGCLSLFIGYGRGVVGRVGQGTGFDVRPLIGKGSMDQRLSVAVRKTPRQHLVVTTQHHQLMEGRHLARAGTLADLKSEPDSPSFAHPADPAPDATMYADWPYEGHKWGMSIDLTACVGCSACVIACQAENNIPVVGKEQVGLNRHMHWMRIDTYYTGSPERPEQTLNQPVTCMHCERAPCEVVCPVAATNHSDEGLNQMIYNRCVGTRYCSNNCPYKVRRFNFLDYSDAFISEPSLQLLSNPEVTMRQRGVMEKCTYCIQRIEGARVVAQLEDRPIRDGDVKTACQAVCPAQAIRFGDLNDPQSQVRLAHDHPLTYGLLEELNTKPRTTYLAEVTNPQAKTPTKVSS